MRKKGQNFLVDRGVIDCIAGYASLMKGDRVLEIGPGKGNLTEVLSARAGCVYAIEVDPALAAYLMGRFENVCVIRGDALKVDFPDYNKVVSNLPYQISSKITFRLLLRPFELAVLMYQRDFARRMMASVGMPEYGRLSVVVGFFCDADILEIVPKSAFRPMPDVESAIVRLKPRQDRPEVNAASFMRFIGELFSYRRKKVKKALAAMGVPREELARVDLSLLEKRPEELTPDEMASLAKEIEVSPGQL